jgi:hypothetical protein
VGAEAAKSLILHFFLYKKGFEWSGAGAMKKEHYIALSARR